MKRLLITGGSGFVGGHLVAHAKGDWQVFAAYHSRPISPQGVTSLALDLADEKAIEDAVEKIQPNVIIHAAAWSNIDGCEKEPERAFHINATATEILAELTSRLDCRLVYVSSDMVFDGEIGDYKEDDDTRPVNVYGKTKLMGEKFIQSVCQNYVIARSALIYGHPMTNASSFSEIMLQTLRSGKIMPLFTDQFRTPILVQNLAQALLEIAGMSFTGTIHLGGSQRVDRYTFGCRLAVLSRFSETQCRAVSMADIPMAAPRPWDVSLNIHKAKRLLKTKLLGYFKGLEQAVPS